MSPAVKTYSGRLALLVALFAFILGAKLILIDRYGSDLPYWDQWDAEGELLYQPYMEGRLTMETFLRPHNEHRIAFTRLLALGLFVLNDHQWDARLQMVVNAALHAAIAVLLLIFARHFLSPAATLGFAVLASLFFGMQVSWENTLSAFQSQFYFLLLFTCLHLGGTILGRPRSVWWWLAPLAGAANLFTMASGCLSAATLLAVFGLTAIRDRRLNREILFVLATNAGLLIAGLVLKTELPAHEFLKSPNLAVGLDSWLHQLAWPITSDGIAWLALMGLVPPLLLFAYYLRRQADGPVARALLGLGLWMLLQTAAIAYARGATGHGYSSRYTDLLAFGFLTNLMTLAFLATRQHVRRGWLLLVALAGLAGLARESTGPMCESLPMYPKINAICSAHLKDYLLFRSPSFNKIPFDELPYPSAERLAMLLDRPVIRAALPASVRPPIALVPDAPATHGFSPDRPEDDRTRDLQAWSAASPEAAAFVSQYFTTDHSRVTLLISARADAGPVHLRLVSPDALTYEVLGSVFSPDDRFKRASFSAPSGVYRLEVSKGGPGRLTFTQPYTNTPLSHLTAAFLRLGPRLLGVSVLLGISAAFLLIPTWGSQLYFGLSQGLARTALALRRLE